jgi:lysophospholipase L1-like esterase
LQFLLFRRGGAGAGRLLVAILLLSTAAACGSNDKDDGDGGTGPSPLPSTITYTAVGASDAVGYGSSVPCMLFSPCPDGRGYVPIVARELEKRGQVTVSNLGLPGAVLSPTIQQLGNQYGRGIPGNFLEQEMPFVPRASNIVTIFAGGNDANAVGAAVRQGAGGPEPTAYIDQQVQKFATDYATLVRGIRDRAPSTRVIVLNLPNMAALPYNAGLSATERRYMRQIAVGLSRGANAQRSSNAVVIDLMCDPRSYQPGNYSADGFHPNDAGYAFIASEVIRAIDDPGGYPAPQQACGFMDMGR